MAYDIEKTVARKIIDCTGLFEEKSRDEEFAYDVIDQIKIRAEKNALENADEITKKRIRDLEVQCLIYRKKLQRCLPFGLLMCVVIITCIIVSCLMAIIMQILTNTKIVDYHILVFVLIGGIGLFDTSLSTIKGWKRYLNDEED